MCKQYLYLNSLPSLPKVKKIKSLLLQCLVFPCLLFLFYSTIDAKTKLACVGNSITAHHASYVTQLTTMLGNNYEVRRFARGGRVYLRNSHRSFWKTSQFGEIFKFLPDTITILLGTCDSKIGIWDKHSKDFRGDVQALIDTFSTMSSKPTIFIAFPPYVSSKNSIKAQNKVIVEEIIPALKEIAAKNRLSTIDSHTPTNSPDYFPDGVHPNSKGNEILANVFYKSLTAVPTSICCYNPAVQKQSDNSHIRSYRSFVRSMTINKSGLTDYTNGSHILFEKWNGTGIEEYIYYLLNGKQIKF